MGFGKTNVSGGNNDEKLQAHLSDKGNPHGVTAEQIGAVPISHGFLGNATSDLNTATEPGHYLWIDNAGDFGIAGHMYDLYVSNQKFGENPAIVQRMTRVYCGADIAATFERAYYYANGVDNQAVHWTDWKRLATTDNLCNPNLLDNWYFGRPVDQRNGKIISSGVNIYTDSTLKTLIGPAAYACPVVELTSTYAKVQDAKNTGSYYYAAPGDVVRGYIGSWLYTIDRWFLGGEPYNAMEITDEGIHVSYTQPGWNVIQKLENVLCKGNTYTFSAVYKSTLPLRLVVSFGDNKYFFNESSPATSEWALATITGTVPNDVEITYEQVIFQQLGSVAGTMDIKASKLELGSTQTLAHREGDKWVINEVPEYGEQLLRCCMSMADPADGYANNKRTPGVLGAVNRAGDTMTGALGVNNNLALLSGYTDSASTLAQLQAVKDNLNSALLQLERPLDDKTWPNVALYQRVNGGDYTLIGSIIHTGNIENYAAKIVGGTYTGDGNASMSITLPFTPRAVYVCPSHGGTLWIPEGSGNGTTYTYGGLAVSVQDAVTWRGDHSVVAIQTGGFTAYYAHRSNEFMYAAANMKGQKYNYIAFV